MRLAAVSVLALLLACPVPEQAQALEALQDQTQVPAQAQEQSLPCHLLQTSITRILSLIKHPDYVNPMTREPLRRQIEDEVYHIFDFGEFSARTIGQAWATFSAEQQQAFTDAFANLLFSTYLNRIDGYDGEEVRYVGERSNSEGSRVEVKTELTMQDGRVIPIAYRLMPKGEGWIVYDIFVEGVSLVRNYRTQFQDILANSSPDELIARVQTRAVEVGKNHESD